MSLTKCLSCHSVVQTPYEIVMHCHLYLQNYYHILRSKCYFSITIKDDWYLWCIFCIEMCDFIELSLLHAWCRNVALLEWIMSLLHVSWIWLKGNCPCNCPPKQHKATYLVKSGPYLLKLMQISQILHILQWVLSLYIPPLYRQLSLGAAHYYLFPSGD